jgi:cation diffusion facilitator family transporter
MCKIRLALLTLLGGFIIFFIKILAYLISGSVALLSDALESTVNIMASLMMLYAVYVSSKPPDEEHQFGHEKVENISCLMEGILILIAALFIIHTALDRVYKPVGLTNIDLAVLISLSATSLNGILALILSRAAVRVGSLALEGDSRHLLSDVLTSGGVALGLLFAKYTGYELLDPLMAFLVSGVIIIMGVRIIWKSVYGLMDPSTPLIADKIKQVLERHGSLYIDFHGLKTRKSGNNVYALLHLTVDPVLTVEKAHQLMDHLEEELEKELPEVTITIHVEPSEAESRAAVKEDF